MENILKTKQPISWLGSVDLEGKITDPDHELYGQCIAGKELHIPRAKGSTVGSYVLYGLAKRGKAPSKIVLEGEDPITIWGAIFGEIPFEISGWKRKPINLSKIEKLGLPEKIQDKMVRIAEIYGDELIPTKNLPTQIAGVSYKTIGDTGLELLEEFAEEYRVSSFAMLNPAGMDLRNWRKQEIPEKFAEKQMRIIAAYKKMGAKPTCTCTPYYLIDTSKLPKILFWSESSAVVYANSVLGKRTNKEGLSSLFYSIAGYGPVYGLHLDENRNPAVEVEVSVNLETISDFAILGYILGEKLGRKIPYIRGIKGDCSGLFLDKLKALGAAGAASGSLELFHIESITPEAKTVSLKNIEETLFIDEGDFKVTREKLNTGNYEDVDLVAFGCPHSSIAEIELIAKYLQGRKVKESVDLWVCTSREVKARADRLGYTSIIEKSGSCVYCDTCMVVAPIEEIGYRTTATNSAKAAYYLHLPKFCNQNVVHGGIKEIIKNISK